MHLLFLALAWKVRCETSFQRPAPVALEGYYDVVADNAIYEVGQSITVEWTTDLESVDLYLVRFYPSDDYWEWMFLGEWKWSRDGCLADLTENSTDTEYPWVVSRTNVTTKGLAHGKANMFYFDIRIPGNGTTDGQSHDFNVTIPTSSTTRPTQTETEAAETGLSAGSVAGVAVGATVGGIAILGGLFFFWRKRGGKGTPVEQMALFKAELPVNPARKVLEAAGKPVELHREPAELGERGEPVELGERPVGEESQAGHGPEGRYEVG